MNYKVVALSASIILLLNGCATMKDASTAMGSTGTGILAGVAAGAGTGILCDKLTGGRNTGACVAAGMAVGAAVGTWAKSMDEAAEKAVPAQSCSKVKERMKYSASETKPRAGLRLNGAQSFVVAKGKTFPLPLEMDLVTPGEDTPIAFKIDTFDGVTHTTSQKELKQVCGGLFPLQTEINGESEGVFNRTINLLNVDGTPIDGGTLNFCYTVGTVNKCGTGAASSHIVPTKEKVIKSKRKAKK